MRPTFSIIFFTVMSGAGYGLWIVVGICLLLLWPEVSHGNDAAVHYWPVLFPCGLVIGLVLVASGLLSSLGHLGKPARAWRALSQWRSSWLSREAVVALLTFVPAIGLAAIWADDMGLLKYAGQASLPDGRAWSEGATFPFSAQSS